MQIAICCTAKQKEELLATGVTQATVAHFVSSFHELGKYVADAFIDLLFQPSAQHIAFLKNLNKPVLIQSVTYTLAETDSSFIRINAWPGFLQANLVEASSHTANRAIAEAVVSCFYKTIIWLPDEPGFVTPRVISMIINEACFALSEGIGTEQEIDTAMKLGTNYPFGPFEWGEKIGWTSIISLLTKLSITQLKYAPAPLLYTKAGIIL